MPMQWLNRSEHSADLCYFCINIEKCVGVTWDNRRSIEEYAMVDSVLPPLDRSEENPFAPGERNSGSENELSDVAMNTDVSFDEEGMAGPSQSPTALSQSPTPRSQSPPSVVDTSSTYQPQRRELQSHGEPILFTQRDVRASKR